MKNLSLDEFRKWISKQNDAPKNILHSIIDSHVESKINYTKLLEKIDVEKGELEEIAKNFHKNGGKVIDLENNVALIEINEGSFYISKIYIRKSY